MYNKHLNWLLFILISSIFLGCNKKMDGYKKQFQYGVASGEPESSSIIIWTKVDVAFLDKKVMWEISKDSLFSSIIDEGVFVVNLDSDGTIKLKVDNLEPSTTYYYRFNNQGVSSIIGRSKTLPSELDMPEEFKIAFVDCNNYQDGYFNAFEALSNMDDIDLVVHLGDYIYEYEAGRYADTLLVDRSHLPTNETITLEDYRIRYAQYRSDPSLQKVHAKFPFLFIWDDHEFANDTYKEGAKNHNIDEGSWNKRKEAAEKAYMEWMPIKKSPGKTPPRQLSVGQLMELVLLEERTSARTKQIVPCELNMPMPEGHTLLGEEQLKKLSNTIVENTKPWTVIANQVPFTGYKKVDSRFNLKYKDWWLGYPEDRKKVINALKEAKNKPIILTGDHHRSMVIGVFDDYIDPCNPTYTTDYSKEKPLAWEILIPSITSKNHDVYQESIVKEYTNKVLDKENNPHTRFADLNSHGFVIMHFTPEKAIAKYIFMNTIKKIDSSVGKKLDFELQY